MHRSLSDYSAVSSLSSHCSKKVTLQTLQVRGWTLDDLVNSGLKNSELAPEDMEEGDYMKSGDLAATLVQSGAKICIAVLKVNGFKFDKEKGTRSVASLDDLENPAKQIKISGQIIDLHKYSSSSPWEWVLDNGC
jgi:hypothetical protein